MISLELSLKRRAPQKCLKSHAVIVNFELVENMGEILKLRNVLKQRGARSRNKYFFNSNFQL